MEKNKRIIDYTGAELVALFAESGLMLVKTATTNPTVAQPQTTEYIYGISGLANLLGISTTTAQKIKNSGQLNGCYYSTGRKLTFDKNLVLNKLKSTNDEN